jgi:hypothetical protein
MLVLQIALGILLVPVIVIVGASIAGLCMRIWDTGTMIPVIATIYAIGVFLYWAVTHVTHGS